MWEARGRKKKGFRALLGDKAPKAISGVVVGDDVNLKFVGHPSVTCEV